MSLGGLFGGGGKPKMPKKAPTPAPVITREDPNVQTAAAMMRRRKPGMLQNLYNKPGVPGQKTTLG